jgi:hypothetical protein
MRFFDLENIAQLLSTELNSPLNNQEINRLLDLTDTNPDLTIEKKREIVSFLSCINTEKNLVFYSWILDSKDLKNACIDAELEIFELSKKSFYLHLERDNFFNFMNPFLKPILERKIGTEKINELHEILFYTQLLTKESKLEIQAKIKSKFDLILNNIEQKENLETTYNLLFIKSLNLFDRSFYNIRSRFIEIVGSLLLDDQIPVSEKQKMATASRKINLNEDHRQDLDKFIQKAGLQQVRTTISSGVKKKFVFLIGLVVIIIFAFYITNRQDASIDKDYSKVIPPYGTDSLSQDQINYINAIFKLDLDTINQDSLQVGLDMDYFEDTIK